MFAKGGGEECLRRVVVKSGGGGVMKGGENDNPGLGAHASILHPISNDEI